MKIHCDVILDLLPLVKDRVASEESERLVQDHLINCQSCKDEYETFQSIKEELVPIKDEKIISSIKRRIYITQLLILSAGIIVGVGLFDSTHMLYNFIIMPIIGCFSFVLLKKKWYVVPFVIFILTFIWQSIMGIVIGGYDEDALKRGFILSFIYTILVILGVIITKLLQFAFRKEG